MPQTIRHAAVTGKAIAVVSGTVERVRTKRCVRGRKKAAYPAVTYSPTASHGGPKGYAIHARSHGSRIELSIRSEEPSGPPRLPGRARRSPADDQPVRELLLDEPPAASTNEVERLEEGKGRHPPEADFPGPWTDEHPGSAGDSAVLRKTYSNGRPPLDKYLSSRYSLVCRGKRCNAARSCPSQISPSPLMQASIAVAGPKRRQSLPLSVLPVNGNGSVDACLLFSVV